MTKVPDGRNRSEIIFYQTEDAEIRLQGRLEYETVWLTQKMMAALFHKDIRTISEHIRNILDERELQADSVIRKFRIIAEAGKSYETNHYNLDVIISVGYRVKSHRGTQFRIWATQRLREYTLSESLICESCGAMPIRKPLGSCWQCTCGELELYPLVHPGADPRTIDDEI